MKKEEKQLRKNLELANQELLEWRVFRKLVINKLKKYTKK